MPGFTESSITVNFPDANFFRFETCAGYRALSGNYLKEMDTCWFDSSQNTYWLFELKDFSAADLSTPKNIEARVWDLVKKAVDSISMFLSVKHAYPYHTNFLPCFPVKPTVTTQFKVISIIHCNSSQAPDVQLLHNSFRTKFKPYAALFGILHYAVVEHTAAVRNLNGMIK